MPQLDIEQIEKLNKEQDRGRKANAAYKSFIKPYFDEKEKVLFEAFKNISISSEDELMAVKRMLYAVNNLHDEILSIINTGKMADETLSKIEEVEK